MVLLTGAAFDSLAALQLLLPANFAVASFSGLRQPGGAGQLALESAALLLGWSAIEVWASFDPLSRRAVMYTGLAVLTVFLVQNLWLLGRQQVDIGATAPIVVLQLILATLFIVAIRALGGLGRHA